MRGFIVFPTIVCLVVSGFGQENSLQRLDELIPLKTAGGLFFWGDVFFSREHHIQKNVKTGTHRLLDVRSVQRANGSYEACKRRLEEIESEDNVLPLHGRVVILLHGFGSNSLTMRRLAEFLRACKEFDAVCNMTYPSTQQSILEHAQMLEQVVNGLPPTVTRIDFVGHSLGSIVMRRYLSGPLDEDWRVPLDKMEYRGKFWPDNRVGRFVMLGPPNHGAEIAVRVIGNNPLNRRLGGESGDELGIHWHRTELSLGIPCCPFGIIAGGRGDGRGYNTLISEDNDGIVSTEGTRLQGTDDWTQFLVGHGEMLLTEEVHAAVLRFLEHGRFRDETK